MMTTMKRMAPSTMARLAGALYMVSLAIAITGESVLHGKLAIAAESFQILGMVCVTLLLWRIFMPVNRTLSGIAAACNIVGLAVETSHFTPNGVPAGLVIHGFFCILIAWLMLRSSFLPRFVGALMALGGTMWLTFLSPSLVAHLTPYNLGCAVAGEVSVFLWLLIKGVNDERWKQQAGTEQLI